MSEFYLRQAAASGGRIPVRGKKPDWRGKERSRVSLKGQSGFPLRPSAGRKEQCLDRSRRRHCSKRFRLLEPPRVFVGTRKKARQRKRS